MDTVGRLERLGGDSAVGSWGWRDIGTKGSRGLEPNYQQQQEQQQQTKPLRGSLEVAGEANKKAGLLPHTKRGGSGRCAASCRNDD